LIQEKPISTPNFYLSDFSSENPTMPVFYPISSGDCWFLLRQKSAPVLNLLTKPQWISPKIHRKTPVVVLTKISALPSGSFGWLIPKILSSSPDKRVKREAPWTASRTAT
jgi:hypothetical protein